MSINNVFQSKKSTSCVGIIGTFFMTAILVFVTILFTAWLVWSGVEAITRDGWDFWPVLKLTAALVVIGGWFGKSK